MLGFSDKPLDCGTRLKGRAKKHSPDKVNGTVASPLNRSGVDELFRSNISITGTAEGHEALVQLLVEKGADIAAKTGYGETALHLAVARGCEAVAQLLVEKGANVAVKNSRGQTPLHLAATWLWSERVAQLLINNGADIAAKDADGHTDWT